MKDDKHVCGICKWNTYDRDEDSFYCGNTDSDYYTAWNSYDDTCEEWKEKGL